jgi:hypothetical protein
MVGVGAGMDVKAGTIGSDGIVFCELLVNKAIVSIWIKDTDPGLASFCFT